VNFRKRRQEEPEINLIPFIDVLLVVLIFLMLSTTYSRFNELQVRLPVASADALRERPREIVVAVGADGLYAVNRQVIQGRSVDALSAALIDASRGARETVVVISADARAAHQAVITVMEAARRTGLTQITFATQTPAGAGR
jgi:biopolymer transport protein ExbD